MSVRQQRTTKEHHVLCSVLPCFPYTYSIYLIYAVPQPLARQATNPLSKPILMLILLLNHNIILLHKPQLYLGGGRRIMRQYITCDT